MSDRILESSQLESFPFPLQAPRCVTIPVAMHVESAKALSRRPAPAVTLGCLRGFCWAMAIEMATTLSIVALWRFLR